MMPSDTEAFAERHPRGLFVLFATEMWERFGFYSMLAMFTLYLKDPKDGFGWTAKDATDLYANYLMFVYASPLIGGWLADKKLGYRNSVLIGGVIFMIGYFLFAIRSITAVYAGLACLVIGNGFFKPNVSAMVGHLYPEGSSLKDRAYNIFYMGINIGALLAPINAEIWVHRIGFNKAFAIAGLGMIVSVSILWAFRHLVTEGAHAGPRPGQPVRTNLIDTVPDRTRIGALIVIFLIVIVFWMVFHQNGSTLTYWADDNTAWKVSGIISNAINPFWVVTLTFPVVWLWGSLNRRGLEPSTPMKMTIGMFLTAVSFAILYVGARSGETADVRAEQYAAGDFRITDLTLDRLRESGVPGDVIAKLDHYEEQPTHFLWLLPSSSRKFSIKGRKFASDAEGSGEQKLLSAVAPLLSEEELSRHRAAILKESYLFKVSPFWLIVAYAVVTLGELMLSPMGLSLVSKVSPIQMRGLMMGGWFVATAIGNKLTMIGVFWDRWLHSSFFALLGAMAFVMGVVLILLLKPLKRAMPGV